MRVWQRFAIIGRMTIIPSSHSSSGKRKDGDSSAGADESGLNQAAWQAGAARQGPKRSTVLSAKENAADASVESKLRPQRIDEYIGQTKLKSMLKMSIAAAKARA